MFDRAAAYWRRIRPWLNRHERARRILRLDISQDDPAARGLILVQIDGLARSQLQAAIETGRVPFLRSLIHRQEYALHSLYSGLPATTPAVQGELLYGIPCAVPSFEFRDHESGVAVRMLESEPAKKVEERLALQGRGLLQNGSAYCDIYSGGATESNFCASDQGMRKWFPGMFFVILSNYPWSVARVLGLAILEILLAIVDVFRGIAEGKNLFAELLFVPKRVIVSILLRELITIGACIDAVRGLPIVHVNYLNYDEQSHRRGPGSKFAHKALSGTDACIRQIWLAAHQSRRRDYDVWIYSDHGQAETTPYSVKYGRSVEKAIEEVIGHSLNLESLPDVSPKRFSRAQWLRGVVSSATARQPRGSPVEFVNGGPIAQLYLNESMPNADVHALARSLVEHARIPFVLGQTGSALTAWTPAGEFQLPQHLATLFTGHPFQDQLETDLRRLCQHPDAGRLILCGWSSVGKSLSFVRENGGHGGPGEEETHAFALLPRDIPISKSPRNYLRAADLREMVSATLQRNAKNGLPSQRFQPTAATRTNSFRVMTYNVHSCVGMDGTLSPERIARVIASTGADIIALQELDLHRTRSRSMDQSRMIAAELGMDVVFHPAISIKGEHYGDAILSRYPLRLIYQGQLSALPLKNPLEPRAALWVEIDAQGTRIQIINTHLSLNRRERLLQVDRLLGPNWLGHPDYKGAQILCGDLNATPNSRECQLLRRRLRDVQRSQKGHASKTWSSRLPLLQLDHILYGGPLAIVTVKVPSTDYIRKASDHLPLIAEFAIEQ